MNGRTSFELEAEDGPDVARSATRNAAEECFLMPALYGGTTRWFLSAPDRRERLLRLGEERLGTHGRTRGFLHPEVGRDVAELRHALELRADRAGLLHLPLDLERDHVAHRVVGQVQERVDHVGVDGEQG